MILCKHQNNRPSLPQGIFVEEDLIGWHTLVVLVIGRITQGGPAYRATGAQQSRASQTERQYGSNARNKHGGGHSQFEASGYADRATQHPSDCAADARLLGIRRLNGMDLSFRGSRR